MEFQKMSLTLGECSEVDPPHRDHRIGSSAGMKGALAVHDLRLKLAERSPGITGVFRFVLTARE
jgi:hypothetical protein